jgi:twitching motility protein PilU
MDITPYLKLLTDKGGSDLTVQAGFPVKMKLNGKELPVGKMPVTPELAEAAARRVMNKDQIQQLVKSKKLNFNYKSDGGGMFFVDAILQNNNIGMVFRPAQNTEPPVKKEPAPANTASSGDGKIKLISSTNLLDYLRIIIEQDASDLFLTVGSQIKAKIQGSAVPLSTFVATPEITKKCAYSIMDDEQIEHFERTRDLDFAIAMPDNSGRFRINAFFQRKTVGMVLRLIPSKIPTVEQLGTPEILSELVMQKRGLLLMVGGTGSGKSTTLAAMVNHRNQNSPGHILTIEDPVEFSHPNLMSIVNQREVGVDTDSYATAIKASLREAPDVILIGEIRTEETMEAALELANTGHLCLSTLHANNANQAIERIVNLFPTEKHKALFMDMSGNLRAIVSQRLIPDVRGKRCAAIEIMINTPNIAGLILKGRFNEIKEGMKSSGTKGMQTFDDALYNLYKDGKISLEEALKNADSRNDLEGRINFG